MNFSTPNSRWLTHWNPIVYSGQAAVDSSHQVIIAADVIGSGSEQAMLLPMIEQAAPYRAPHTLVTADAGYHSDANVQHLLDNNIPTMIADNQMRSRDERRHDLHQCQRFSLPGLHSQSARLQCLQTQPPMSEGSTQTQ